MTDFYTYAYLREDGTPYYVGKGKGNRAYNSYGRRVHAPKDKTRILILKRNLTENEAFRHEKYIIFVLGVKHKGTGILLNHTEGGEGPSGLIHTEESRKKMSLAGKGKPKSKRHRENIAAAKKGKPRSDETKQKLREANLGKKASPETRAKLADLHTGKTHSEATKNKIRKANIGKKHTEETKEKIRQARLARKSHA